MIVGSIPKYLARPAATPHNILSSRDLVNFRVTMIPAPPRARAPASSSPTDTSLVPVCSQNPRGKAPCAARDALLSSPGGRETGTPTYSEAYLDEGLPSRNVRTHAVGDVNRGGPSQHARERTTESGICGQNWNGRSTIATPPPFEKYTESTGGGRTTLESAGVAVIGAGRLGTSLALALTRAHIPLAGFVTRTPAGKARAEAQLGMAGAGDLPSLVAAIHARPYSPIVFFLTVPDGALPAAARELAAALGPLEAGSLSGVYVAHTSGATSVEVLAPCAEAGAVTLAFHPLQTFSDPATGPERLRAATVAVTPGEPGDLRAWELALQLAAALGARPFLLREEDRPLYHAAAVLASNYLVALEHAAETLFHKAGLPAGRALPAFLPLVQGAVDNIARQGTAAALTGPLSRGDLATIRAHLDALTRSAPDYLALYQTLGLATLDLVKERNDLPPASIESMEALMSSPLPFAVPRNRETPVHLGPAPTTVEGSLTVSTQHLTFSTQGEGDVVNLTHGLNRILRDSGLDSGTLTVFAPGATGAVTTLEFEPGVVRDFQRLFDQITPADQPYRHNLLLQDGNGHSHVRAGLVGPSIVVPFTGARLTLGTWQEVVFVCFDNRPRDRKIVVQISGVKQG